MLSAAHCSGRGGRGGRGGLAEGKAGQDTPTVVLVVVK